MVAQEGATTRGCRNSLMIFVLAITRSAERLCCRQRRDGGALVPLGRQGGRADHAARKRCPHAGRMLFTPPRPRETPAQKKAKAKENKEGKQEEQMG